VGRRNGDDRTVAPDRTALAELAEGSGERAGREPAVGFEAEREVGGVREAVGEVGGEAVRRHDVEADAREERDPGLASVVVAASERLEDRNLARDVEVVDASAEASVGQRLGRLDERARAVQHHVDAVEVGASFVDGERPGFAAEPGADAPEFRVVPAGEYRVAAAVGELLGDQFAGVAVGAVDEQVHGR
jgi:hypothetical protein